MKSLSKVRTSVTDYINHSSADRFALKSTLDNLASRLPETSIFGGMLRDFALGYARKFYSDIDLVSFSSRSDILRAINEYSPIENKFGGFRFVAAKRSFDIWAFDDTWAFRQGIVCGSELRDLFKTTFFNLDAAIFHLSRREFLCSEDCEAGIKNRFLELNMKENPSPYRMTRRAISMSIEKDLAIGPKLASFMLANVKRSELDRISNLFMDGLEGHVKSDSEKHYVFNPQQSFIS